MRGPDWTTADIELYALNAIVRELLRLDQAQRARTMRYLTERFGERPAEEPEVQRFGTGAFR